MRVGLVWRRGRMFGDNGLWTSHSKSEAIAYTGVGLEGAGRTSHCMTGCVCGERLLLYHIWKPDEDRFSYRLEVARAARLAS